MSRFKVNIRLFLLCFDNKMGGICLIGKIKKVMTSLKIFLKKNIQLRNKAKFVEKVVINDSSFFEGGNTIYNNTVVLSSNIGYGTYIGESCYINCCNFGRYCCVGPYVKTAIGSHPTRNFASVHPAFFP